MNRLLVATTGALLVVTTGCARREEPEKQECQLESFDLSSCDRSGLAAVKAEGIWQVNVTLGNSTEVSAMNLSTDPGLLFGLPLSERRAEGDTFFLGSDFHGVGSSTNLRFALAACESPSPERLKGQFRRCADGAVELEGTFEAVRVSRPASEQEASGVELVSERALTRRVTSNVPAAASDVVMAGGYAYVTALADGLFIFDVSNPASPTQVAELTPRNDVWHQARVKDQTLYVSSNREGIILYDVSRPEVPKRLRAVPVPSVEVWGLLVDQNRLYALSPYPRAEVLIYDITTPTAPSLLSRYFVEDSNIQMGQVPVDGAVLDNRLYIAHWRYGLAVTNVTDPVKPAPLGRFTYDGATSRVVAVGAIGGRTIAFESSEGWGSRVRALDVTDPQHLSGKGSFALRPESTVRGLTLVGSRLYVAHNQDGLRILDVSNPDTLRQVAYYNTWRETDPGRGRSFLDGLNDVEVPGDGYLYATETSRGLLVFRER